MEISIARALNELTLLDARINRAINEGAFVAMQVGNKAINDHVPVTVFNERAKSSLQSVQGLIKRRNIVKAGIVKSNAETIVTIGNEKMTVAEAIERKTSIVYKKQLLNSMRLQYNNISTSVTRENQNVKARLDKSIETLLGKETKGKQDEIDSITKSFNEMNEAKVVDPLAIVNEINKLTEEIETFTNEVDFTLTESNVRNSIVIPD